ncbi:MAG: type IV pilus twitching motility protein PilT [Lachnospiraceae bacterium]|nr:type IV pilus twitching motility protein PilT [Lachnospiraceae bacterium]
MTIQELLAEARQRGASDVHISVGVPPKFRIHGLLEDMISCPRLMPEDTERIIQPMLSKRTTEVLVEKGEVDFSYSLPDLGRFRVNIFKQRGTYAAVLRLINTDIPSPEQLGLPNGILELTKLRRGLVLVTGPTGSGKSTTLASLMNIINETYPHHCITLEDPIEYVHNHKKCIMNQREVGLDTGGFGDALRAALREDPDVILVGEMRDLDTIQTALTAAETGHLVFSTLHTIGAAPTVDRIIDVFPPEQQQQTRIQLAGVLEAVISQQIMPVVGGRGRTAAFEVMLANPAIKNLIREAKSHQIPSMIQTNKKIGMQLMDDAIYDLYLKRKIDADTALSYAVEPAALEKKMF